MKKLTQTILTSLFAAVFLMFFSGCPNDIPEANEANRAIAVSENESVPQRDAKIYSRAAIKDDTEKIKPGSKIQIKEVRHGL